MRTFASELEQFNKSQTLAPDQFCESLIKFETAVLKMRKYQHRLKATRKESTKANILNKINDCGQVIDEILTKRGYQL